jgi:hypothetical protein
MSLVKWWLTQQALPRSAIFTDMMSPKSSPAFSGGDELADLSRFMPDTSRVKMSLMFISFLLCRATEELLTQSFLAAFAHLQLSPL